MQNTPAFMNLVSGRRLCIQSPTLDQIDLFDIAVGVAYKPHFSGQTPRFFSIAEHCLLVHQILINSEAFKQLNKPKELELIALLHDAAEAYLGDMITQVKAMFPGFKDLENRLLQVIFTKYRIDFSRLPLVKFADLEAQRIEFEVFYNQAEDSRIHFHSPDKAKFLFVHKVEQVISEYYKGL